MHKEEMEGGMRIKSRETQLVHKEEMEWGTRIESREPNLCVNRR
jgi:hypothetical protein